MAPIKSPANEGVDAGTCVTRRAEPHLPGVDTTFGFADELVVVTKRQAVKFLVAVGEPLGTLGVG